MTINFAKIIFFAGNMVQNQTFVLFLPFLCLRRANCTQPKHVKHLKITKVSLVILEHHIRFQMKILTHSLSVYHIYFAITNLPLFLCQFATSITHHAIELESCSNLYSRLQFFLIGKFWISGILWVMS